MKEFIDEKELSALTGIKIPTLRGHRFKKIGFPYHKIAGLVRYKLSEIEESIEKNKVEPKDDNRQ